MSQRHQKTHLNETTPFVELTSSKRERKKEKEIALRRKQKKNHKHDGTIY